MMKFWTVSVVNAQLQMPTFSLQSKGDCFLSANTKLVSLDKAVKLTNKDLAIIFRDAILPIMRRRHGELVQLKIGSLQINSGLDDDLLVIARIAANQFAPNQKPTRLFKRKEF